MKLPILATLIGAELTTEEPILNGNCVDYYSEQKPRFCSAFVHFSNNLVSVQLLSTFSTRQKKQSTIPLNDNYTNGNFVHKIVVEISKIKSKSLQYHYIRDHIVLVVINKQIIYFFFFPLPFFFFPLGASDQPNPLTSKASGAPCAM